MILSIKPARRAASKALIGLVGPSGAGKTLSALMLAKGLVSTNGGKIVVVDTEGADGRALQYAEMFDFLHAKLPPPYSADRFREAFVEAEEIAEGGCVILDSCSAEHEDQGGALEQHGKLTGGDERKNMRAWGDIRPAQRRWMSAVTKASCHVICCFRADDKTGVEMKNGKMVPVALGWQAIGWKRWPYELQISVLLSIHQKGVPIIQGFEWGKIPLNMADLVRTDRPLDEATGKRLAEWLSGGDKSVQAGSGRAPAPAQPASGKPAPREWTKETLRLEGEKIAAALRDHGDEESTLDDTWSVHRFTIDTMPDGTSDKLRAVLAEQRAKIQEGKPVEVETRDDPEGPHEGRDEDPRQEELIG